MLKPVVVAAAALAIAGSSIVYAQQRFGGPGGDGSGGPGFQQHYRQSPQDMAAFTDARIAALKAGLQLTPDQAKNWPAFEQALRDMAKLHIERMQARRAEGQQNQAPAPATPFDRLGRRADTMSKTGAALKQIADTGTPLYQSLDDAQKHRFHMLARMLRPHHHMHAAMRVMGLTGVRDMKVVTVTKAGHGGSLRTAVSARTITPRPRSCKTRWRARRPGIKTRSSRSLALLRGRQSIFPPSAGARVEAAGSTPAAFAVVAAKAATAPAARRLFSRR